MGLYGVSSLLHPLGKRQGRYLRGWDGEQCCGRVTGPQRRKKRGGMRNLLHTEWVVSGEGVSMEASGCPELETRSGALMCFIVL